MPAERQQTTTANNTKATKLQTHQKTKQKIRKYNTNGEL
jgi:hypothetical protein